MGARGFLLLGKGHVLGARRRAGGDESVVTAGVELQFSALQVQDEFAGGVQQVAVMADDQDGAAILLDEILQPQHAFQVEIIGGLVEQQKIGRGEQDRGQRHAHAPAAGKFAAGAELVFRRKTQSRQDLSGAGRRGIGVDRIQPVIDFAQLVAVGLMFGFRQKAQCAPGSASSTVSSRFTSVPGASWATAPTRQDEGTLISPSS